MSMSVLIWFGMDYDLDSVFGLYRPQRSWGSSVGISIGIFFTDVSSAQTFKLPLYFEQGYTLMG